MAFSFGNAGAFGALQQQQSASQGQVQNGSDLPEITTEVYWHICAQDGETMLT